MFVDIHTRYDDPSVDVGSAVCVVGFCPIAQPSGGLHRLSPGRQFDATIVGSQLIVPGSPSPVGF